MMVGLRSTGLPSSSCALFPRRVGSSPTSLSVTSKLSVGLLRPLQSFPLLGSAGKRSLTAEFYRKVHQCVHPRGRKSKATQARVCMMPLGIPMVIWEPPEENSYQVLDLWNALYREHCIFIGEHINEAYGNMILTTMLYLDTLEDLKMLYIFISGPGGDLTPSLAVYDTMRNLKHPVGTKCVGGTENMGSFILTAGDKGYRLAMPLSRISFQAPGGTARGRADDVQNEAKELGRVRDYLFKLLSEQTGQPVEKIREDLKWTKRFSSQEAVDYGIIDRIVRPTRDRENAVYRERQRRLGDSADT